MNVNLAVLVDELGSKRADFFRDELSKNLSRVSGSSRVVLQAVLVEQLCARAVGDYKAVGCGSVVVRRGEALVVHSSRAASGDDYNLGLGDAKLVCLHVHQDGAGGLAFFVFNQFNGGRKVNHCDFVLAVKGFVAESAHDFGA